MSSGNTRAKEIFIQCHIGNIPLSAEPTHGLCAVRFFFFLQYTTKSAVFQDLGETRRIKRVYCGEYLFVVVNKINNIAKKLPDLLKFSIVKVFYILYNIKKAQKRRLARPRRLSDYLDILTNI